MSKSEATKENAAVRRDAQLNFDSSVITQNPSHLMSSVLELMFNLKKVMFRQTYFFILFIFLLFTIITATTTL